MDEDQNMANKQRHAQTRAHKRLTALHEQGHHINIEADTGAATITITRTEGFAYHTTVTPVDLEQHVKEGAAYKRYPQSVLIAEAVHRIADWSEEIDRGAPGECLGCGQTNNVSACYNIQTGTYDWYCHSCFYGDTP